MSLLHVANRAAPGTMLPVMGTPDVSNPGFATIDTTGGGGGTTVDRELIVTTYRATAAGTGYSIGDTITATRVINVTTSTPTQDGATIWYNETTAAAIAAPSAANLVLAGAPSLTDAQLRASAVSVTQSSLATILNVHVAATGTAAQARSTAVPRGEKTWRLLARTTAGAGSISVTVFGAMSLTGPGVAVGTLAVAVTGTTDLADAFPDKSNFSHYWAQATTHTGTGANFDLAVGY